MPASSTVVNAAESADLRLIHLLGNHEATSAFVMTCEDHISNADAPNLLSTIFQNTTAIKVLMSLDKDEAVGAFSLLSAYFDRVDGAVRADSLLRLMVGAVESYRRPKSKGSGAKAVAAEEAVQRDLVEKRLNMLSMLYNLRSSSKEKVWILGRIVQLSVSMPSHTELGLNLLPGRNATLGNLLSGPAHLEGGCFDEEVTPEERRALYGIVAGAVGKVGATCRKSGMDEEGKAAEGVRQRYLLKFLGTYRDGEAVDKAGLEAAREAAVGAIRDPVNLFHEQRSIMGLTPVAALETNKGTKPLYALLQIFQEKKLQDFQAFVTTSTKTLSQHGLKQEDCIRHMRLLSLCSLATEHEEIPYDAIATTLQIEEKEVEKWVIAAVSSGLLSAKMDQLQRVVMVEGCVVRRFGMEQWEVLQKRLDVWKRNVRGVLEGLKQSSQVVQQ